MVDWSITHKIVLSIYVDWYMLQLKNIIADSFNA